MQNMQRALPGLILSLLVMACGLFVVQRFFLPLAWASVLSIATWPLYSRVLAATGNRPAAASALFTALVACVFLVPVLLGLQQAFEQAPVLAGLIADANNNGIATPPFLRRVPLVGSYFHQWWQSTLAQPHGLARVLSEEQIGRLHSASEVLRRLGSQLFHRMLDFGFSILCLFFFFKDGPALQEQLMRIGRRMLGARRWQRYCGRVPAAVRATVNGLVLVGLGEGVLVGIGYAVAGLPSPALWGAATCVLAIIPFGAPVAFLAAAAVLAVDGQSAAAAGVVAWGLVVLFVADHLVRPVLIGNATRLPFLAVLFGILGGVETLGLVGLFIGPVLMVLLVTLWREAAAEPDEEEATAEDKQAQRLGS